MLNYRNKNKAFSLVEILLAISVFSLMVLALTGALVYGEDSAVKAQSKARAVMLANEAVEAVRNIRDGAYTNIPADNTYGLTIAGNKWSLSGSSDVTDIYTRTVQVSTIDANTKRIVVNVNWNGGSISTLTDLTNWATTLAAAVKSGLLVYGDGGTTTDAIKYKTINTSGVWSAAASTADVDGATTNKALRGVQLYSSSTRNEKIMLSKHFDGTNQYIYAQVYDGTTWGHVQLLTSWGSITLTDAQNFSGTYLNNGDFMVAYGNNTNTPSFRTWNGTAWSSAISMHNVNGTPVYIVIKARPSSNDVMAAIFDNTSRASTEYFNGGTYSNPNWSAATVHGSSSPSTDKKLIDFVWSPNNNLIGGLIFTNNNTAKIITSKIWTDTGANTGAWSASSTSLNIGDTIGPLSITGFTGSNLFSACSKTDSATPVIFCSKFDFTPTWTSPTNSTIAAATVVATQRTYDASSESSSGTYGLSVYSDNTATPKLKKYTVSTNTWDVAATSINALGGTTESVKLIPYATSNDLMILMTSSTKTLYSIAWNGTTNTLYALPAGYNFTTHGNNGSAITDYWYDFAWD